ncbi:MAG: glycosyltransferase family 9 protein [bacterium]|nr:glycosyltransferase family 9 protein [bacterium]
MSLKQKTSQYKLIVINNGSNEYIKNEVKKHLSDDDIFLDFEDPVGVACAYNEAIKRYCDEKYFVIVHNDVIVSHGWLENLLVHAEKIKKEYNTFCCIYPRTNYANESSPSLYDQSLKDKFIENKINNKIISDGTMIDNNIVSTYDQSGIDGHAKSCTNNYKNTYRRIDESSSFCTMYDVDNFKSVGGFDNDFIEIGHEVRFLYFMSMSINNACCFMAMDTYVHHNGNTTSDGPGKIFPEHYSEHKIIYDKKCNDYIEKSKQKTNKLTQLRSRKTFKLLFIREGGIGDIIMSMFALNGLKSQYKNVSITYLTHPSFFNFVSRFTCVDRVEKLPDNIRETSIDTDLINKFSKKYIPDYDSVINCLKIFEIFDKREEHRVDMYVEKLDIPGLIKQVPEYSIKDSDLIKIDKLVKNKKGAKRIAIAPIASCTIRSLSSTVYRRIIEKEAEENQIILLHDAHISLPKSDLNKNVVNLTGKLDLDIMPALIKTCDYIYSVDTGAFHIAGLMGVPCRAFFGPINPELRDGYYRSSLENKIFYKKHLPCVPCNDHGCADIPCMKYEEKEIEEICRDSIESCVDSC